MPGDRPKASKTQVSKGAKWQILETRAGKPMNALSTLSQWVFTGGHRGTWNRTQPC